MGFPEAGQAIPSTGTGNIKFSDLRLSYINNEGGGGNEGLNNEEGVLNLSFFRNATFTSGDPIPESGAISIGTDFCEKTFAPEEGEGEPEPGGSENIRITLTDAYGDGWDDDGDTEGDTHHNNLEIRNESGTLVFSVTNYDNDGDGGDGEDEISHRTTGSFAGTEGTGTIDITLSAGNYTVKLAFAQNVEGGGSASEYGEFISDKSYDISLIGGSSLVSHTFTNSDIGATEEHEQEFTVS